MGRLPCSYVTMALLASYAVQSHLGDYDEGEHGFTNDYLNTISFFSSSQGVISDELAQKVFELHKTHTLVFVRLPVCFFVYIYLSILFYLYISIYLSTFYLRGLRPAEAEYNFLMQAKNLAMYGVHLYDAMVGGLMW